METPASPGNGSVPGMETPASSVRRRVPAAAARASVPAMERRVSVPAVADLVLVVDYHAVEGAFDDNATAVCLRVLRVRTLTTKEGRFIKDVPALLYSLSLSEFLSAGGNVLYSVAVLKVTVNAAREPRSVTVGSEPDALSADQHQLPSHRDNQAEIEFTGISEFFQYFRLFSLIRF